MATVGQISIAMTTNTAPFTSGLNRATGSLNSFSARVVSTSNSVGGLFAAVASGAAVAAFYKMAKAAAEMEDSLATVKMVFGDGAGKIEAQAEAMAVAYGLVKRESFAAAGSMGAMLRGVGFDEASAAAYSNTLVRLAADFKAAFGGTIPEALARISSGLRGEVDPLEKFGVTMSAANVEAQTLRMGLQKLNGEYTSGQIIQARAALIIKQSESILGAAASQADGAAMQMEALSGRWENLTTTIGETFAPVVGAAMGDVGLAVEALRTHWAATRDAAGEWAMGSLGGMEAVTGGAGFVERAIKGIADAWQVVSAAFHAVQVGHLEGMKKMLNISYGFAEMYESITGSQPAWAEGVLTALDSITLDLAEARAELKAEWSKPWASEGIGKAFDAERAKIKAAQTALAAEPTELPAVKLAEEAARSTKAGKLFGEAMLKGSAAAQATVLRVRHGGGGKDPVADNTAKTAKGIEALVKVATETNAKLAGLVAPVPVIF